MNVIPKAGQVWKCVKGTFATRKGQERVVTSVSGARVGLSGSVLTETLQDDYEFIPKNDLEWLAVNCDEYTSHGDAYNLICRSYDKKSACFAKPNDGMIGYTRQQWQQCRDELCGTEGKEMEKPVYTQAMKDNGELPPVGVECSAYIYADTKKQGRPMERWVDCVFISKCTSPNGGVSFLVENRAGALHLINACSHIKPVDTRTEDEKLRDTINEMWDAAPDKWAIIEDIINNDKFTITLNKGES